MWFRVLAVLGLVVYGIWVQGRTERVKDARRQADYASNVEAVEAARVKDESVEEPTSPAGPKSAKASKADDSESSTNNTAVIAPEPTKSDDASAPKSKPPTATPPNRPEADRNVVSSRGPPTDKPLGVLKDVGNRVFVSTAGLRYGPGGAEGHRLDHLRRHDNDMPSRAGKHGVFDGDERQMLATIDEGWLMVQRNAPEVKATKDGARTAYDISFGRRIGFLGGQDGRRQGNPPLKRIKLVVQGKDVVTAYPF